MLSIFNKMFYQQKTRLFSLVNDFLSILIIVSISAMILESVASFQKYNSLFLFVEYLAISVFSLEYIGRILGTEKKTKYIFSFFGIIDLLSIIPSFLHLTNLTFLKSGRALRILRFLRILRLLKINKYKKTNRKSSTKFFGIDLEIYIVAFISVVIILGTLVYAFEQHQPGFRNIPETILWVTSTILEDSTITTTPTSNVAIAVSFISRFLGIILLGFLMNVVGTILNRKLLNEDTKNLNGK